MFKVPAAKAESELIVKKSRFIAWAAPATSREEALQFVTKAKQQYPDARHHCWAYLVGNPQSASSAAMNDDGEPSGTAGKPILNVIQHKGIGNLVVVIIRYFGGTKLGAGGLVRAYGGAAEQVLSALPVIEQRPLCCYRIVASFADEQPVRHWLNQHGGELVDIDYSEQVTMTLKVDIECKNDFEALCESSAIEFELLPGGQQ